MHPSLYSEAVSTLIEVSFGGCMTIINLHIWPLFEFFLSSILEMSSSYQNYIFEVLTKTNNSQTFVQMTKEKFGTSCLSQNFSDAFSIEAFLGWGQIFFQFCNIFPGFCQKYPCFSRFSRCGPIFPGFPGAVGTLSNIWGWCVTPHSSPTRGCWPLQTIFNILNNFTITILIENRHIMAQYH